MGPVEREGIRMSVNWILFLFPRATMHFGILAGLEYYLNLFLNRNHHTQAIRREVM